MAQIMINIPDDLKDAVNEAVAAQNNASFVASGLSAEAFTRRFLATFMANLVRGHRDKRSQEANASQSRQDATSITFE